MSCGVQGLSAQGHCHAGTLLNLLVPVKECYKDILDSCVSPTLGGKPCISEMFRCPQTFGHIVLNTELCYGKYSADEVSNQKVPLSLSKRTALTVVKNKTLIL